MMQPLWALNAAGLFDRSEDMKKLNATLSATLTS